MLLDFADAILNQVVATMQLPAGAPECLDAQVIPAHLIEHDHVERRGRYFLLLGNHVRENVRDEDGRAVTGGRRRDTRERKHHVSIRGKQFDEPFVAHPMGVLGG